MRKKAMNWHLFSLFKIFLIPNSYLQSTGCHLIIITVSVTDRAYGIISDYDSK